jgi:hypothetical protein
MCLCRAVSNSGTSLQSEVSVQESKQKELYITDFIQAQELKSLNTSKLQSKYQQNKKHPPNKNQNKTQINNKSD